MHLPPRLRHLQPDAVYISKEIAMTTNKRSRPPSIPLHQCFKRLHKVIPVSLFQSVA